MNNELTALEIAQAIGTLRDAMRNAYEDGQLVLAKIALGEIVKLNSMVHNAEVRASNLPSTMADDEVGRIVRERAAKRGNS